MRMPVLSNNQRKPFAWEIRGKINHSKSELKSKYEGQLEEGRGEKEGSHSGSKGSSSPRTEVKED